MQYAKLQTNLATAANIINDRPVGVRYLTEEDIVSITVNQLLLKRMSRALVSVDEDFMVATRF